MRIVVDTEVASNLLKGSLAPNFRELLAPHEAAITFVTVGELTKWVYLRDLGARRRGAIEAFLGMRPKIPGGADVARRWGEIVAYAQKRGRPGPVNDSWIAACCLAYDLPLATLNVSDFEDFAEYEGLRLITP